MTKITPCSCVHRYQDETYGKGMRVHNAVRVKLGPPVFRCTVCGQTRS